MTGAGEWLDLVLQPPAETGFLSCRLIPGRALMLLQAQIRLGDGRILPLLFPPDASEAAAALSGGPQDFMGNASFAFGAALLAPYANRIRGTHDAADRSIETLILGHRVRLPANGGGKAPGTEQYAIHGLILARPVTDLQVQHGPGFVQASGVIRAGDYDVGWPSSTEIDITWRLEATALSLSAAARNVGEAKTPIGFGWHPYFALPSGARRQARLRLPARSRLAVNNYDEVLPTGEILPVANTPFDFRAPDGVALGDLYLDDCFVDLGRGLAGEVACEVTDPAAGYGLRISTPSAAVSAVQAFAPPDRPFVVIEPQFNWANPYGREWAAAPDSGAGMVLLGPGASVSYEVKVEPLLA